MLQGGEHCQEVRMTNAKEGVLARSTAGRAACSSTSYTPLQRGQRSNQGFLSSQRDVQAAADFMNLAFNFLGFYLRTPSNKVTFYPKILEVFLTSFHSGKLKILVLGEQNMICISVIYFNYFADQQQTYNLVIYLVPPCCPHLTSSHFI